MRRVAKGRQSCGGIFEELNVCTVGVNTPLDCGTRSGQNGRAVEVKPYRECACRGAKCETGSPGLNPRDFPAPDNAIQPAWSVPSQKLASADWKVVDAIKVNNMGDVEIRVATADSEIP